MNINRRTFLKQIGAIAALMTCSPTKAAEKISALSSDTKQLTLLHTNDVHSHIEPFAASDPKYAGLGGYARRKAYIDAVRNEGNEVLVFDCGDIFQGTPYFNLYDGRLEIELMNKMGIDGATIGNHEFDNGIESLCDRMEEANFPFICANYSFVTERAQNLVKPYKIFERCGRKIGVLGLGIKIEGLINTKKAGGTIYNDPIETANTIAAELRRQGCSLIIALSHLGYTMKGQTDDVAVASQSRDIDIILGGHTHTFMSEPVSVANSEGRNVWINQVGYAGINIGRFDVIFDDTTDTASVITHHAIVMA